ncbi:hypothetical protein GAYE_SCF56G6389 [Galdieria yellowstonensis]|uniref:glutathione transferase n=1 Tax=Galdieria yellowstonensis TaxID=3028027 RepID=A0AAV9IM20_9RHOD|nr:hypothetical protein GAYE_SCF56G6389 [Galdieria yellowstonensis]
MSYTLTYFPIRGRAEHARLLLEDNQIPYKSQVVQFGDEWKSFKAKGLESGELPFGQVPVLHDGNLHLAQSGAIARYLARKHNKYGADDVEKALNDMMFDMGIDIQNMYVKFIFDENHKQKKGEFVQEVKGKLDLVEKFMKRQGKPYLASSEPTFADYLMFEVLDVIKRQQEDILKDFPLLQGFYEKMGSRPNIVAYRKSDRFYEKPVPVEDS